MTEEQLDKIRFRFGGDWYETWWWTISERFDSLHSLAEWEPDFFERINQGWLDMYYVPPTEEERIEKIREKVKSYCIDYINSNPYYNEQYYPDF